MVRLYPSWPAWHQARTKLQILWIHKENSIDLFASLSDSKWLPQLITSWKMFLMTWGYRHLVQKAIYDIGWQQTSTEYSHFPSAVRKRHCPDAVRRRLCLSAVWSRHRISAVWRRQFLSGVWRRQCPSAVWRRKCPSAVRRRHCAGAVRRRQCPSAVRRHPTAANQFLPVL